MTIIDFKLIYIFKINFLQNNSTTYYHQKQFLFFKLIFK